jgi:SAM-dependent methyltransferase
LTVNRVAGYERLYRDLSWTWPIISPPEDYRDEAEEFVRLVRENSRVDPHELLHLGCGGGHIDAHIKKYLEVTGVDVSASMLRLARHLNPEVEYHRGDMRTTRLKRKYDAVIIADSISYMQSEHDLAAAFRTSYWHLKPGGVFVTYVEETPNRFVQNRTVCSRRAKGDIEIVFVENAFDPDTDDTSFESTFVYLIRKSSRLRVEVDRHFQGIFPLKTWRRLLRQAGFGVKEIESGSPLSQENLGPTFVCVKPLEG